MRSFLLKCVSAVALGTLACSSGELTGLRTPDGTATSGGSTTVGSVVITPPASNDLIVGQTLALNAIVQSTTGQSLAQAIAWSSSDPSVIAVSTTGTLTAVKLGTALITGSASGKSASLTMNVKGTPVGNVVVTVPVALMIGQSAMASVVATDATGVPLTGRSPAWSSRNPGTAIVSPAGVVTGISVGSTVIDAVVDGIMGSANLQVASAAIGSISVTLTQSGANPGQSSTASAVVTDVNGATQTDKLIAWSSSNNAVATITQLGVITAVAAGSTTITAASEGRSGTANFLVTAPSVASVATVNLSIANARPSLGLTSQVSATLRDAAGNVLTGRLITWASSSTAVATVSATGLVTAVGFGSAAITANSENASSSVTVQVIPSSVSTVSITPPPATLQPTQTTQLLVATKDAAGTVLAGRIVTYSSSVPTVATVSATGLVTALARGNTVVTVTSEGVVATVTITIPPVAVINVSAASPVLQPSVTSQVTAALLDGSGTPTTNRVVTWTTSNPGVATVSASGLVTAVAKGTANITATSEGVQGSLSITVPPVTTVNVAAANASTLVPAQTTQATATLLDATGLAATNRLVTWTSSAPAVATVSAAGLITALTPGSASITASSEGVNGTLSVVVALPAIATVVVSASNSSTLQPAQTTQATATLTDVTGASAPATAVTWTTSAPAVATVSASGLVTAVAKGSATITATSGAAQGTLAVTIPPVATVNVTAPNASTLQPTLTTQASATLLDATGTAATNRQVTWTSSMPTVATVSATGFVTAVAVGTATITAASEGVNGTVGVVVALPAVTTVTVTAPNASTLQPTQTTQATATLLDATGTPALNRVVTWTSSAPAVATVSATGLVTALTPGTATISASSGGVSGTLSVVVSLSAVATITVAAPNAASLQPTQTSQAVATLLDASGTPLNRVVTWTSSTPAVASVSATGIVTAVAAGSTTITASSGAVTGTVAVVVPAVNSVAVTATASSLAAGSTAQATATLRDAGNVLATNRAIAWSSNTPAVATVSATGLVTAVAVGSATVSAVSEGKTGTFAFTVLPPGGTISIATPQNSLLVNDQTQLTASMTNTSGAPVPGASFTWSSSDSSRATVSPTGIVKQVAGGNMKTVTITARSGTASQTSVIQLVGHQAETVAALPQIFMNTAVPAAPDVGGVVISVAANGNLQAAINAAQLGDVIELANGAVFTGNFSLPNKGAGTKWITIRPANMSGMPAPGNRMTPSIAAAVNLPSIQSPNSNNAVSTAAGAHHYRFIGIDLSVKAGVVQNYAPIALESNSAAQTQLSQVPHDFVLDRVYIHGNANLILRRCLLLNSAYTAVIDSDLRECHDDGSDSQAIAGYNGPGPFKIVNNYLEGAGENVIFGGSDPGIPNLVPSDIEIRRNHFNKPASWKGGRWLIKNHLELKNSQRVLIEGNIFENNWAHGQDGTSIVLKSVNQGNTCAWCVTQDVTVRYNIIRNVGSGFNIGGSPDGLNPTVHARRMTITDNYVTGINTGIYTGVARGFYMSGDPADVTLAHNTVLSPGTMNGAFVFGPYTGDPTTGQRTSRWNARDNVMDGGSTGLAGDRLAAGPAFNYYAPGGSFVSNVMVMLSIPASTSSLAYPKGNYLVLSYAAVGFVNTSGPNYALASSSPHRSVASDGRDPGADLTAVSNATANVIVP